MLKHLLKIGAVADGAGAPPPRVRLALYELAAAPAPSSACQLPATSPQDAATHFIVFKRVLPRLNWKINPRG